MFDLNAGGLFNVWFPNWYGADAVWSDECYFAFFGLIILTMVVGYLCGSVNSAIIISRVLYKDDIRKHGSGNAGMTNMNRTYGLRAAGLTLIGDLLKTVIAIVFAGVIFGFWYAGPISTNYICYLAGLSTVIGHVFPLYYGFKGGKGVLATATMALVLTPVIFLVLILLFILIVYLSRYVSLGSVSVAVLYPVLVNGYFVAFGNSHPHPILALATILLAILIVVCHMGNLKRISERTEHKLSFGKKKEEPEVAEGDDEE